MAGKMIVFFLLVLLSASVFSLQLEKVLIISRHNLRTPLTKTLATMTPKKWPKWDFDVGFLTSRGLLLERYMGEYFSAWLNEEGLLPEGCPEEKDVHIYANTRQRTKATAKAFSEGAFINCNVPVHFKNITEMDPIFNPVVHNATDSFKQIVTRELQEKLNGADLKDVYLKLNEITDIKNSEICKTDGFCDLTADKNKIVLELGQEPNVRGPFSIGNSMVDSFLMSFYAGLPSQDIAWGEIKDDEQWKLLTKIVKVNQNVRFNLATGAKDFAFPLLKYLREKIESETKLTLLVCHDSNLSTLLSSMGFRSYVLPDQFELTPIGGKLIFQKWTDGTNYFLKVVFVYQSTDQLRNAAKLTMANPPKNITMSLEKCIVDKNGFCPWVEFEKLINDLVG